MLPSSSDQPVNAPEPAAKPPARGHVADLAILGLTLAGFTFLTWRKWADILVDFGLQLYLPWQLSNGAVLYRDVAYLPGGPLSQYYHALLFRIFGVSLSVIVISNLLVVTAMVWLVYRAFVSVSDRFTAMTATLAIVLIFAFGYYTDIGNYNYVTPYSHEAFHGLALSIVMVVLLSRWFVTGATTTIFAVGLCWGLTFLTKPEIFLAQSLCLAFAFGLNWISKRNLQHLGKSAALLLSSGSLPVLGFFIFFCQFEGVQTSARFVAWPWVQLLTTSASHNAFYRWCLGMDAPWFNIGAMLLHFTAIAIIVTAYAFLCRRALDTSFKRISFVTALAVLAWLASAFYWGECGRALPLLSVVLLAMLLAQVRKTGLDKASVFPILWTVFGAALLAKLGLYCRIWHYGFALAMPAFLSAIYLLLWVLPRWLERFSVKQNLFRATMCVALGIATLQLVMRSEFFYGQKNVPIGKGADRLWTFQTKMFPAGPAMAEALQWLDANAPANATLAVLPEGVMLNYMSRRLNPTGYASWNPPELAAFGQDNMFQAFCKNSPDYVILIGRDSAEYGEDYFGKKDRFGRPVMQYIRQHYQTVHLIGYKPLQHALFGLEILKRTSQPNPSSL